MAMRTFTVTLMHTHSLQGNCEIEDHYIHDKCYIKSPHHPDQALQQDNLQP